jgi:hypothetical protein
MPVVVLCGLPRAGKSALAKRIAEAAPPHLKPVTILSDRGIEDYAEPQREKTARSRLRAALERAPYRERLVIVDACNLVSGFRYELWCVSRVPAGKRQESIPHVTVLIRSKADVSEVSCAHSPPGYQRSAADRPSATAVGLTRLVVEPELTSPERIGHEPQAKSARSANADALRSVLNGRCEVAGPRQQPQADSDVAANIARVRERFEWPDPQGQRWDRPLFTMSLKERVCSYETPDGCTFFEETQWVASIYDWISGGTARKDFKTTSRMTIATRQTRVQSADSYFESEIRKIEDAIIQVLCAGDEGEHQHPGTVYTYDKCPLRLPESYLRRIFLLANQSSRLYTVSQDLRAHRHLFVRRYQKRRVEQDSSASVKEFIRSLEGYLALRDQQRRSEH